MDVQGTFFWLYRALSEVELTLSYSSVLPKLGEKSMGVQYV
jgi:hypothetical protein